MKKSFCFFILVSWFLVNCYLYAQESNLLKEGIRQYKEENYEEAAEILEKVRKENPKSSIAAFFLGLAYKQMMKYPEAAINFRDAVTLTPRIKDALVELIDVLYRIGKLEEAKKWIRVAEKEKIYPAKIAFLKGLILQKENKDKEAIRYFEKAKSLNPKLKPSCDFQIGICYIKLRKLKKAKQHFEAVVSYAPYTDLATFARRYQDLIEKRMELEKPIRIALLYFFQYDDNVILRPSDEKVAVGITGEQSVTNLSTIRIDFIPRLSGPWLFSAYYSYYSNFHRRNSTSHDIFAHTVSIAPGYNFGRSALNLLATYSYVFRHKHRYMDTLTVGPLFRTLIRRNNILECFAGYTKKKYLETPLMESEDRDSIGIDAYLSWIWFFKREGFFNLRYEFIYDDTEGVNWENYGNRFTINVTIPLVKKVKFQFSGEAFFQDFQNTHTVFNKHRNDHTYTFLVGFTFSLLKHVDFIIQYTRFRCDSNIAIYDYTRNLLTSGIEIRF